MGLAASQAQLLSITSRMSDNELRAQLISNDKQRLATDSSQVSDKYVQALNDAQMVITNYDAFNNQTSQKLTFNNLTRFSKYNQQYGLSNLAGQLYVSEKDADMFQRAIAARDPLTSFLNEQGFFYETSYFDNLDKYLVNGDKVAYRGQDAKGQMTTLSTDYTVDQLKTMYFGESPLNGVNGIYHKGFEKITPDFNIYTDLVSRTQGLAKEFNKLVAKDLASFTINNISANGITPAILTYPSNFVHGNATGTIGALVKELGGTITEGANGSSISWEGDYTPNRQYTQVGEALLAILKNGMETPGLLSSKGSKTLEGVNNGDPVNGVWANAYEKTAEAMKPQSYTARFVDANGNAIEDISSLLNEDGTLKVPGTLFHSTSYNPYEAMFANAFTVAPFEARYEIEKVNTDEYGNFTYEYKKDGAGNNLVTWYQCYTETSDGEAYDPEKINNGTQTVTIVRTALQDGGNIGTKQGDGITPTQNGVQNIKFTLDFTKLDPAEVQKIKDSMLASKTAETRAGYSNAQGDMVSEAQKLGYTAAEISSYNSSTGKITLKHQQVIPAWTEQTSEGSVYHPESITYTYTEYNKNDIIYIKNENSTDPVISSMALVKPATPRQGTEAYGANTLLTNINSIATPAMPTDDAGKAALLSQMGVTYGTGQTYTTLALAWSGTTDAAKNQQLAKNYANSVESYVNTNMKPSKITGINAAGEPVMANGYTTENLTDADFAAIEEYQGALAMAKKLQDEAAKSNSTAAGVKATASAKATEVANDEYNTKLKPLVDAAQTAMNTFQQTERTAKLDIDAQQSMPVDANFKDLVIGSDGSLSYNTNYAETSNWDVKWNEKYGFCWWKERERHETSAHSVGNFEAKSGDGRTYAAGEGGNRSESWSTSDWILTVITIGIFSGAAENDRRQREAKNKRDNEIHEGKLYNLGSVIRNQTYKSTSSIDEKGNVTFTDNNTNPDGTKAADSHEEERFLALRQILEEFLGSFSPETEYSPAEMMHAGYISLNDNHPAKVIWDQLMKATEELSEFLFGDKNASKDYNGMCDMDGLRAWYDNPNAAKTPQNAENQTMRNVIDGGMLERVFNTYGEPKLGWVDKEGNDCEKEAQWYTNLFNRMKEGYKALEDGLAADPKWIDYALKSGLAVMEQVDGTGAWAAFTYTNCADINEKTDSVAVATAEAEYTRAMNKIQAKDKRFDIELKQIDTEHNSLQVEYDSVKAAMDKNMERTFKIYSA